MRAMVYRGPYKIRVEEKDVPVIERPNDAIVRVGLAAICGSDLHLYHGKMPDTRIGRVIVSDHLKSRMGDKRTDSRHQVLDPVIIVGPWVGAAAVSCRGVRVLVRSLRR
jgi:hypothetical protein